MIIKRVRLCDSNYKRNVEISKMSKVFKNTTRLNTHDRVNVFTCFLCEFGFY